MDRDRSLFRRALEVSVLVHLLLLFLILPRVRDVWPSPQEAVMRLVPPPPPQEQTEPLDFEFVDMEEEREETPPDDRPVPLSDMDRRAHGGEGEAAQRPASSGNTPQLIQSRQARPVEQPLPPVPQAQQAPDQVRPTEQQTEALPEGIGQEKETEAAQRVKLPAPREWMQPPEQSLMNENPDRIGGQVDSSGISFDTRWYDWGPYARAMLAKIRRNWYERMPEIVRWGVQGVVKIRFYIERDGTVTGVQILSESGRPPLDLAARDAIVASSALDPLPADLVGVTREGVTITFYYNLRPSNPTNR